MRFVVAVEFGFARAARVGEHFSRPILFSLVGVGHSRGVGGGRAGGSAGGLGGSRRWLVHYVAL